MSFMGQFYKIMLDLMINEKVDVKTYRNADATMACFINNIVLNFEVDYVDVVIINDSEDTLVSFTAQEFSNYLTRFS